MELVRYTILGFAPGLFWLWYLRHEDDLQPEPRHLVLLAFGLGCLATIPVLWAHPFVEAWVPHALGRDPGLGAALGAARDAFLVTAPLEEAAKLSAFVLAVSWHRHLDEPLDGIIYGAAVGLGFASVENVIYLQQTGSPLLVLARGSTATLAHVATTGSMGFLLGMARFSRPAARPWLWLAGIGVAILFHGAYDLFLISEGELGWVSLVCVLPLMLVALGLKIRWSRARSALYPTPDADPADASP